MDRELHYIYRFSGCVFDSATGELTKGQFRLRISEQNARLLHLLLEHPGNMVTREQVRVALWPGGEVLQYDQSINRAVSQLRSILRDHSPKAVPLIETIPKRGYRMAAGSQDVVREPRAGMATPEVLWTGSGRPSDGPAENVTESSSGFELATLPKEPHREAAGLELPLHSTVFGGVVPARQPGWFGRRAVWPAAVCLLLLCASGALALRSLKRNADRRPGMVTAIPLTIAPFESSGQDADILAESFRANLTDALSQSPDTQVRSLHTWDGPRGVGDSTAAGPGALLLFGKFNVRGDQCRLELELVRAAGNVHLASLQYQGNREELAEISDRAEADLFQKLHPGSRLADATGVRPTSLKSYAAYLRGRALLLQWTDDALQQAVASFRGALAEDPQYARAYAGMASAYFVMSQHQSGSVAENLNLAGQAADTALSLDPGLAEAHAIRGEVMLMRDWDFAGAQEQLQRAVTLDPNHAIYHQWLSVLYGLQGSNVAALAEIDTAHSKDPDWPPLYMTEIFLAASALRFDRAEKAAAALLRLKPDWPLAHEQFAMSLWAEKKYEEAIAQWRIAAVLEGAGERVALEDEGLRALRKGGVSAYARLRLRAMATHRGVTHADQDFEPAEWEAYAGDTGQALTDLHGLVAQHSSQALQIASNPAYNPLHDDPRYVALIRRIGLSPGAVTAR